MSSGGTQHGFTFECQGARLLGVVHRPAAPTSRTGVMFLVPGGPQTRTGVCRSLVLLARELAGHGITCMRFDQRGVGDSGGEYRGFECMEDDVHSACRAFLEHAPQVSRVVMWGECDAASAVMMTAWREQEVSGIIAQNPWMRSLQTEAKTLLRNYYRDRIRQKSFWLKVLKLQFMPWHSVRSFLRLRRRAGDASNRVHEQTSAAWDESLPFQSRMLEGMKRLHGPMLLFLSQKAKAGQEFEEVLSLSQKWRALIAQPRVTRVVFERGVHKFDSKSFRSDMVRHVVKWVRDLDGELD